MGLKVSETRERLNRIKKEHGDKVISQVTIQQLVGGMRGVAGVLSETSGVDPYEGVKFRGMPIKECLVRLPSVKKEPIPESMFYLLLTGEVPSLQQAEELRTELVSRSSVPFHTLGLLNSLPNYMHPSTQLSIGINSLQSESKFYRALNEGAKKPDYWEYALEDALDLVAKVPMLSGIIYRNKYYKGNLPQIDQNLDLSANFARLIGWEDINFWELLRLYFTIHSDHEGGNVSAHTTHLVGSALSDPYLSYSSAVNGLAGPLHGLASQECFKLVLQASDYIGNDLSSHSLEEFIKKILEAREVIPGFGHAVLRVTDPRFLCLVEFSHKNVQEDRLCRVAEMMSEVVPKVLQEQKKCKDPHPNVDSYTGALLAHYGLKELDYFTVLFAIARAIGCMSSYVWDKALMLPIERPDSLSLQDIEDFVNKK